VAKTKRNRGARTPADKDPGFYLYTSTWLGCEVKGCSYEAKGLWIDMLCVMHAQWPRGVAPGQIRDLAALLGYPAPLLDAAVAMLTPLVGELETAGVFSRGEDVGEGIAPRSIVNRRMYRDWAKEHQRKEHSKVAAEARWRQPVIFDGCPTMPKPCPRVCPSDARAMPEDLSEVVEESGVVESARCPRDAQGYAQAMPERCHSLPYLNDPNPKTDLNAFSGDRTLTACARAREPQSLAAIIGSPRALVDAIRHQLATLNLNGAWSTWFATTISTAPPDTLGELSDLIAYVHSCQDPTLRKAKDLSPLKDPATYLAVRWSRACVRMGATLPPFPHQETHRA